MSRIPEWVERYVSLPYDECDCWQLVEKVYAAEYGIHVGAVREQRDNLRDREWTDVLLDARGFIEGDVILFRQSAVERHVGILLTPDLMLHTQNKVNSSVERWTSNYWKNQLVAIYRHMKRCTS